LAAVAATLFASSAAAAPHVDGEFPVESEIGTNNKIAAGPDGNMWATVTGGKDVARITPAGQVTEYNLEAITAQGIAAAGGKLWITRNGGVTSFEPANPEATKKETEINQITTFHSIVLGPDGNLWVATENNLVRINPANPEDNKAFEVKNLSPRDIDVYGSGLAVSDADGTNPRILTATTADPPVIGEIKLGGASQGLATKGNQIAFSEPGASPENYGLFTPPGPPQLTPSQTDPFGVALGIDGAFWIAQFTPNALIRLTADNTSTQLKGFASESGPRQLAAGPDNTLWVTLDQSNKVGRVSGLEPPVTNTPPPPGAPSTKIDKGPKGKVKTKGEKAKVKFRFSSPDKGATFECRMVKKPKKGKKAQKKKPAFKGCKSPKEYRLKPGRYTFEVRAVLGGVRDATPAKRSFQVVHVSKK
jgi:streptogramin lyase